jgi:hypothetical protein
LKCSAGGGPGVATLGGRLPALADGTLVSFCERHDIWTGPCMPQGLCENAGTGVSHAMMELSYVVEDPFADGLLELVHAG